MHKIDKKKATYERTHRYDSTDADSIKELRGNCVNNAIAEHLTKDYHTELDSKVRETNHLLYDKVIS